MQRPNHIPLNSSVAVAQHRLCEQPCSTRHVTFQITGCLNQAKVGYLWPGVPQTLTFSKTNENCIESDFWQVWPVQPVLGEVVYILPDSPLIGEKVHRVAMPPHFPTHKLKTQQEDNEIASMIVKIF